MCEWEENMIYKYITTNSEGKLRRFEIFGWRNGKFEKMSLNLAWHLNLYLQISSDIVTQVDVFNLTNLSGIILFIH